MSDDRAGPAPWRAGFVAATTGEVTAPTTSSPTTPAAPGRRSPATRAIARLRRRGMHLVSSSALTAIAGVARLHPRARPHAHGVEVLRDLPYLPGGSRDHLLDVYRPLTRPGPWPVVFYVHGGAFSLLSKDTHWVMGLAFARHGYLVVNISYRLAPTHPFPAAIADTCAAWQWMVEHVEALGGDLGRVAVAGESAGANLITALTLATTQRRPEPWARRAFDTGVAPHAALPFCGMLQVSDPARFAEGRGSDSVAAPTAVAAVDRGKRRLPPLLDAAIRNCSDSYLGRREPHHSLDLADPLCVLERDLAPHGIERPLPPFFAAVGTRDPLLPDTRRLEKALADLGVPCEARYYPGGIHAFHAMVWNRDARRCWRDALAFLDRHLRVRRARHPVHLALPAASQR
ncbi:MAG: alpha/beta hydrolase [Kofleriaceae bacterium]|nr:alpha/beta hydrolase [Kofleriaceae bacterium]